ncbi:hypothetical protein RB595_007935 [Gaeumannomyces hyphopodioides]
MIRSSLGAMLKASMRFNDLIFVSQGREFPAHRLVAMTQSPVLEKLIQSGELAEVNSAFSSSAVEYLLEYLYTESYACPFAMATKNETATPEPVHSAARALELTDGDSKLKASNDTATIVDDLISFNNKEMDPVVDSALFHAGDSAGSSQEKSKSLVVQGALIQHLHVLGLANMYQVHALADVARGYIANILSRASSAGPALQVIEEMKATEKFDGQVWDLLCSCIMSHVQSPFGRRLLGEVFILCDKIRTDALCQKSINDNLGSELAVAQAQLHASKDCMAERHSEHEQLAKAENDLAKAQEQIREMRARLDDAAPGLKMLEEVQSANERILGIINCRNTSCCANYSGFKGRVQVDHDLLVTARCLACLCKH